jgi:hypothetical protein
MSTVVKTSKPIEINVLIADVRELSRFRQGQIKKVLRWFSRGQALGRSA